MRKLHSSLPFRTQTKSSLETPCSNPGVRSSASAQEPKGGTPHMHAGFQATIAVGSCLSASASCFEARRFASSSLTPLPVGLPRPGPLRRQTQLQQRRPNPTLLDPLSFQPNTFGNKFQLCLVRFPAEALSEFLHLLASCLATSPVHAPSLARRGGTGNNLRRHRGADPKLRVLLLRRRSGLPVPRRAMHQARAQPDRHKLTWIPAS